MQLLILGVCVWLVCICSSLAAPAVDGTDGTANSQQGENVKIRDIKAKLAKLQDLLDKLGESDDSTSTSSKAQSVPQESKAALVESGGVNQHEAEKQNIQNDQRPNPDESRMIKELELALRNTKKLSPRQHSDKETNTEISGEFLETPVDMRTRENGKEQGRANNPGDVSVDEVRGMLREISRNVQARQNRYYDDDRPDVSENLQARQNRYYVNDRPDVSENLQARQNRYYVADEPFGFNNYDERQTRNDEEEAKIQRVRLAVLHAVEKRLLEDIHMALRYGFTVDQIINDLEKTDEWAGSDSNSDYYRR
ncbi:hypothetical protein ScPMuIL_002574 [Solemya velum]